MSFNLLPRIIVFLIIREDYFIKTKKFNEEIYIGDPINSLRIFNDLEVDEIVIMDIDKSVKKEKIDFNFLKKLSSECFMPLTYGGGVKNLDDVNKLFSLGIEKISFNSLIYDDFDTFTKVCDNYGAQSVVASIDVRYIHKKFQIFTNNGKNIINFSLETVIEKLNKLGVGEIILTDIERDGQRNGFNTQLIEEVNKLTNIPIIINGGASKYQDFKLAINSGASAVSASSIFTLNPSFETVLIDYPSYEEKKKIFE
jgi:cyclase